MAMTPATARATAIQRALTGNSSQSLGDFDHEPHEQGYGCAHSEQHDRNAQHHEQHHPDVVERGGDRHQANAGDDISSINTHTAAAATRRTPAIRLFLSSRRLIPALLRRHSSHRASSALDVGTRLTTVSRALCRTMTLDDYLSRRRVFGACRAVTSLTLNSASITSPCCLAVCH